MVNSTQLVSAGQQKLAENCSEDVVTFRLLAEMVRTSKLLTSQVITSHAPATVALNRSADPLRTTALVGSSVSPWVTTEHKESKRESFQNKSQHCSQGHSHSNRAFCSLNDESTKRAAVLILL